MAGHHDLSSRAGGERLPFEAARLTTMASDVPNQIGSIWMFLCHFYPSCLPCLLYLCCLPCFRCHFGYRFLFSLPCCHCFPGCPVARAFPAPSAVRWATAAAGATIAAGAMAAAEAARCVGAAACRRYRFWGAEPPSPCRMRRFPVRAELPRQYLTTSSKQPDESWLSPFFRWRFSQQKLLCDCNLETNSVADIPTSLDCSGRFLNFSINSPIFRSTPPFMPCMGTNATSFPKEETSHFKPHEV